MKPLALKSGNIPAELKAIDSWLLWKLKKSQKADGTETWLKVPYYSSGRKRTGMLGTKEDRGRLSSFDKAMESFGHGGYAGIGFATMPEYPLTILDLDKCYDPKTKEYSDFANNVIATGTYVERSPSGNGLRAVYVGEAVCAGKRNGLLETGERVEIYCGSAYVTMTGQMLGAECSEPKALPTKIKRMLKPVIAGNGSGSTGVVHEVEGEALMSPDAAAIPDLTPGHARVILNKLPEVWGQPGHGTWYRVAAALHLQFGGAEEGYQLLDEWSQGLDGYDEENNRKRWNAGFSHGGGREGLTTFRNLVFEAIQNGGLRVKPETMQAWGLARKVEDDFEPGTSDEPTSLPEYDELRRMADIGGMLDEDAPPVDWIVDDLLPSANVTVLAGGSGTSKSYWALELCACGAVGMDNFAGLKIKEGGFKTLFMAYEDGKPSVHVRVQEVSKYVGGHVDILGDGEYKEMLRENLQILAAEILDSGDWMLAKSKKRFDPLEITGTVAYLREYVVREGIDVIVFDTGSEIHSGDENAAGDMVVLMRALRQLASSAGCAILVIQHVGKTVWGHTLDDMNQASIRGSGVLVDKSRNVVILARMPKKDGPKFGLADEDDTHDNYVALKHVKTNLGGYLPLKVFERTSRGLLLYRPEVQRIDPNMMPDAVDEEEDTRNTRTRLRIEKLCENVVEYLEEKHGVQEEPTTPQMLADMMLRYGSTDQNTRMAITALEGQNTITYREGKHRSKIWRLTKYRPSKD